MQRIDRGIEAVEKMNMKNEWKLELEAAGFEPKIHRQAYISRLSEYVNQNFFDLHQLSTSRWPDLYFPASYSYDAAPVFITPVTRYFRLLSPPIRRWLVFSWAPQYMKSNY